MIALRKTLIIVTLLVSVFVRKLNCVCLACRLPQNATEEDIVKFATLDFKERLMKKLGMKTEPKGAPVFPKQIINSIVAPLAGDQARPNEKETKQIKSIVITPSNSVKIARNAYSYTFKVVSKIRGSYEVSDVKLWLPSHINSTKSHRFRVYEKTRGGKSRLLLKNFVNSLISAWQAFKLGPSKEWMKTPWKELYLEIEWINNVASTTKMQPHLQLQTRPVKKRLLKRSTNINPTDDCSSAANKRNLCCKHTMTLNLSVQMPWIMTPRYIQARICKGDCPVLHRTRVPYTLLAQLQKKRKPCCVPTQLSPISVIYYDEGEVQFAQVKDMVVNSCGCF